MSQDADSAKTGEFRIGSTVLGEEGSSTSVPAPGVTRGGRRQRIPGGMIITDHDTVALPTETIRERDPIELTLRDHPAWPGRTLHIYADWNSAVEKWIWRLESELANQSGLKTVIPDQPALYGEQYRYREYFLFTFADLSRGHTRVTPQTLGNTVDLIGYPGPRSPGWVEWVQRQSFESDADREVWLAAADAYPETR